MAELVMPKLGESIMEAKILRWLKKEGDAVALDEAVLEIATDKVDSEVPSPFAGTLTKILFPEGDTVEIGKAIAIIENGATASAPAAAPVAATPVAETVETNNYITIKSPIIGTFYRKPSPDKPMFVEVGKTIAKGDVLCVIEAMKLFNEIESEISGKIVKVLVDDSSPVEFDQPLFLVDPS